MPEEVSASSIVSEKKKSGVSDERDNKPDQGPTYEDDTPWEKIVDKDFAMVHKIERISRT